MDSFPVTPYFTFCHCGSSESVFDQTKVARKCLEEEQFILLGVQQ